MQERSLELAAAPKIFEAPGPGTTQGDDSHSIDHSGTKVKEAEQRKTCPKVQHL